MDEWLDSLPCESEDPSSNPGQRSFFFFSPLFLFFLLARADIHVCAAELATWGVGPNVTTSNKHRHLLYSLAATEHVCECVARRNGVSQLDKCSTSRWILFLLHNNPI